MRMSDGIIASSMRLEKYPIQCKELNLKKPTTSGSSSSTSISTILKGSYIMIKIGKNSKTYFLHFSNHINYIMP